MAKTITISDPTDLLPDARVAARYGISLRTVARWDQQSDLGFPQPLRIRGRKYRSVEQLETWERQRRVAA
jgi:hypothetical protein